MNTHLLIEMVILTLIIALYFTVAAQHDNNSWLKAIVLGVAITLLGLLPGMYGMLGWAVGFAAGIFIIMKVAGQPLSGAFIFLFVVALLQYVVQIGVVKYF